MKTKITSPYAKITAARLASIALICAGALSGLFTEAKATPAETSADCPLHIGRPGYHRRFDDAEKWVKKFDDPARLIWQKPEDVIEALKIQAGDKVADVGAGTGYFSLRIAKDYPSVTVYAADIEPSMIAYLKKQAKAKALPNHKALKIDAHRATLPEVDLVLVVDTYHHIDNRISYFADLKKRLSPKGRVAIIDFTAESPEGPPPEHRLKKESVVVEMNKAGYSLDQDLALLPYQYFLIFK
ncbi:MAG: methyltransferase domain-containing protein [Cyanobacteria bacterium REEB67]|nr:methyltransferase domain-containing protein [Cyanobacteria bacterium REEB67]